MKVQLFMKEDLAIHLYYSTEAEVDKGKIILDELVLFIPGLPQFIDKRAFEDKVSKKRAFMSVYYYGTWLSGGVFTPKSARQTIVDAVMFANLKKSETAFDGTLFSWDFKKLKLMGCSFAGNQILTAVQKGVNVDEVELYNPLIFLYKDDVIKLPEFNEQAFSNMNDHFLSFMRKGYINTLRGIDSKVWEEYFSGDDPGTKIQSLPSTINLNIYQGTADTTITPSWTEFFCQSQGYTCQYNKVEGAGHDFLKIFNIINK